MYYLPKSISYSASNSFAIVLCASLNDYWAKKHFYVLLNLNIFNLSVYLKSKYYAFDYILVFCAKFLE